MGTSRLGPGTTPATPCGARPCLSHRHVLAPFYNVNELTVAPKHDPQTGRTKNIYPRVRYQVVEPTAVVGGVEHARLPPHAHDVHRSRLGGAAPDRRGEDFLSVTVGGGRHIHELPLKFSMAVSGVAVGLVCWSSSSSRDPAHPAHELLSVPALSTFRLLGRRVLLMTTSTLRLQPRPSTSGLLERTVRAAHDVSLDEWKSVAPDAVVVAPGPARPERRGARSPPSSGSPGRVPVLACASPHAIVSPLRVGRPSAV